MGPQAMVRRSRSGSSFTVKVGTVREHPTSAWEMAGSRNSASTPQRAKVTTPRLPNKKNLFCFVRNSASGVARPPLFWLAMERNFLKVAQPPTLGFEQKKLTLGLQKENSALFCSKCRVFFVRSPAPGFAEPQLDLEQKIRSRSG